MPERFDVVVVGGGSAGCVLAARLSENPDRSVCLVEAGPDYGAYAEGRWPDDIVDARALAFSHSWQTDREDRWQLRARIATCAIGSVVEPDGRLRGFRSRWRSGSRSCSKPCSRRGGRS